jgi:glucose/arabinose dehydrogenase
MKKIIALLSTIVLCQDVLFAQKDSDRSQVEMIINQYFEGWKTGDTSKLGATMHSSCDLKNYNEAENRFIQFSRKEYLSRFQPRQPHPQTKGRIVNIDITGYIAAAKVEIITAWEVFTDHFNLMRMAGRWYIVDKISIRVPHPVLPVNPQKETIIEGIQRPWSMAFLNEEEALISEKDGDIIRVNLKTKQKFVIHNFPTDMADTAIVRKRGNNTGKFEILLDPKFKENKYVYISYAAQNQQGTSLKVIRAVLENDALQQVKTIFVIEPFTPELHHYGGGMVFGADGKLYITAGERLFNEVNEPALPLAQDLKDSRGKIYRINSDGSVPTDNPDFGKNAVKGLYAVGIRAAQGLAVEPITNKIWFSEHGTHQGDEINVLKAGANYGWPNVTSGKYRFEDYKPVVIEGAKYTDPVWAWMQTVAPTGLTFYTGNEFPTWKNNLIVPGLSRGSLWRMTVEGEKITQVEELFVNDRVRSRKVVQSPAGRLYLLTDEVNGKIIWIKNLR